MKYQHEQKESVHPKDSINTEAPPAPLREQWALDMMKEYLEGRGLSYERAIANGCYPIDKKGYRVFIPSRSRVSSHVYWQSRAMDPDNRLRWDSPPTPRRDALVVMFGPLRDKTGIDRLVIVEGPMDALAVASLDLHIGIGLMGINPTQEALDHVCSYIQCFSPREVVCVCDRDQIAGMCKIQSYLAMRGYMSKLVIPLAHKDIACYTLKQREEILRGNQ